MASEPRPSDGPTVVAVPSTTAARRRQETTVTTPKEALRLEEIHSTRIFVIIVLALTVGVGIALPLLRGDPIAARILIGGMLMVSAVALWIGWVLRTPERYGPHHTVIFGIACTLAGYCGIYYFGVLSPACLPAAMGIFFFSLGQSFAGAVAIYLACAVGQVLVTALVLTGAVAERAVVSARQVSTTNQLLLLLLIELVFFLTFRIARGTRASILTAVEQLEKAVRIGAQREALLQEARGELDRALHVGGPGRLTDERLGSFRLGALIGRGAMGEVYEAVHTATGQPAAVKVLHPSVRMVPDHARRFLREAALAAAVKVPNVVQVLETAPDGAAIPYLAMERLRGEDLAERLRAVARLPAPELLELLRQVGRGVDAAHAAGVVHRDLKPQNLFRAEQPDGGALWKILDFGVSRLMEQDSSLTAGHVVGTPSYMAPEQARGQEVDARADLFALGAIAYRALTGNPPFSGKEVPQILYKVVYAMPARPSEMAELPEAVDQVLAVAMAKRPDERFASSAALVAALERAVAGEISEELAQRAARVLKGNPWGSKGPG